MLMHLFNTIHGISLCSIYMEIPKGVWGTDQTWGYSLLGT
jgi:hypothetical protein